MSDMRKLMEAVEQIMEEPRSTDASTVKVLGKADFPLGRGDMDDTPRNLHLEVREYNGNQYAEDGLHVYIVEDGYDGFHLSMKMDDFQRLVKTMNDLSIEDISSTMETIEQINEVSDFDGKSLDALIAQFEETCKEFRIGSFPRKQKDLLNVVMARAKDTQDMSGLGHENTLGNDHKPRFGGWPDEQR